MKRIINRSVRMSDVHTHKRSGIAASLQAPPQAFQHCSHAPLLSGGGEQGSASVVDILLVRTFENRRLELHKRKQWRQQVRGNAYVDHTLHNEHVCFFGYLQVS
jgi:hypothetical protein